MIAVEKTQRRHVVRLKLGRNNFGINLDFCRPEAIFSDFFLEGVVGLTMSRKEERTRHPDKGGSDSLIAEVLAAAACRNDPALAGDRDDASFEYCSKYIYIFGRSGDSKLSSFSSFIPF